MMKVAVRFDGIRAKPLESVTAGAAAIRDLLDRMNASFVRSTRWRLLNAAHRRVTVRSVGDLERALSSSRPMRQSEVSHTTPTHRLSVQGIGDAEEVARLWVGFWTEEASEREGLRAELSVGETWLSSSPALEVHLEELLRHMVMSLGLTTCRATPGHVTAHAATSRRSRVGWLTFVPERLGPLPELPPGCAAAPMQTGGWLVRACPKLPRSPEPGYSEALAYVRHALGARVLLDGPSFPPPGAAQVVAAPEPEVAARGATEVPSYLKAPAAAPTPPAVAIASVAAPAAPPVTAAAPSAPAMPTETGAIDLAQLFKGAAGALPFDPSARPGAAAVKAPAASAPPAAPQALSTGTAAIDVSKILKTAVPFDDSTNKPSSSFTETEEFNLSDLLKRGAPVPFAKPKAEPETEELPRVATAPLAAVPPTGAAPVPAAPRGRWIRFNPQTGEPLAAPRWEALPAEEKK